MSGPCYEESHSTNQAGLDRARKAFEDEKAKKKLAALETTRARAAFATSEGSWRPRPKITPLLAVANPHADVARSAVGNLSCHLATSRRERVADQEDACRSD